MLLTLELIIDGGGPCFTSTLLLTMLVTDFTTSFFFLGLVDCLFAFGADCFGELLSTILEGPATTSTFVMICFCSFAVDLGAFAADLGTFGDFSFFGGEDTTDTALDRTAGATGLLVLSLSDILLGLMASGLMLVTDGGGGFVSIIFSCTDFSVFGGSEIIQKNICELVF